MKWLACTVEQSNAINSVLPESVRVSTTQDTAGNHWLNADLLTDCGPGQTYGAAQSLIQSLQPGTPAEFVQNQGSI